MIPVTSLQEGEIRSKLGINAMEWPDCACGGSENILLNWIFVDVVLLSKFHILWNN